MASFSSTTTLFFDSSSGDAFLMMQLAPGHQRGGGAGGDRQRVGGIAAGVDLVAVEIGVEVAVDAHALAGAERCAGVGQLLAGDVG